MNNYIFDTVIFNRIVEGDIDCLKFDKIKNNIFVTHVQKDEINKTPDSEKLKKLVKIFHQIADTRVPTESFVLGTSRLDLAKLGDENDLYRQIKDELDKKKKKPGNIQDALIGEVAIKNNFILVTEDDNLTEIVRRLGGRVKNLEDLLLEIKKI